MTGLHKTGVYGTASSLDAHGPLREDTTMYSSHLYRLLALGLGVAAAPASQAAEAAASLVCGNTRFTMTSQCTAIEHTRLPLCRRQILTIEPPGTKPRTLESSARLKDGSYDGATDHWACVPGTSRDYLLLWSNNGGNCPACEWVDIIDLDGSLLVRGRKPNGESNDAEYERVYKKLGLPEEFPDDAFQAIPLM
jgi:hypothetical protein